MTTKANCGNQSRASGAMSVDVEEYYHASALAPAFPRSAWASLESRVERTTLEILELFAKKNIKATFFTLGAVARAHPRLIRAIASAGHELGSHGNEHFRVADQNPGQFREDVLSAKSSIEDASGAAVLGYRAASFSIDPTSWWAYDILAETGHRYSSSVYPIHHDHYGLVGGPIAPFQPLPGDFVEIPISTAQLGRLRLPAGGGGYFRLMPYGCFAWLHRRAGAQPPYRTNFYFHPWEIDPGQPRGNTSAGSRLRHYVNLSRMKAKIETLTRDFQWDTMQNIYADCLQRSAELLKWSPASGLEPRGNGSDLVSGNPVG